MILWVWLKGGAKKYRKQLIAEVDKLYEISPDFVTHIRKWRDDMIFWLEKWKTNVWYTHIFELDRGWWLTRFDQMVKWDLIDTEDELIDLMYEIINTWEKKLVTLESWRKGWSFIKNVKWKNIAVWTWTNGFIVTISYTK